MWLSTRILGKSVFEQIQARASAPVLMIGKDIFYRKDLAAIGCFNFQAALNLSTALSALQAKDTRDVFENIPPSALVLPHVGSVSLAVLGAAFESKRLGGNTPLEAWAVKHRAEGASREFVTFSTMKHAELVREAGEKRARKQRKDRTGARRDKAQNLRAERYITRREGVN